MSGKEETEQPQQFDLTALDIDQILGLFIGILVAKAWQYMGLRLAPGKKDVEKDMVRAAMAIDCISFITDKIIPSMPDAEASNLRAVITDLKINYAKNV